jgi:hypothetical protein
MSRKRNQSGNIAVGREHHAAVSGIAGMANSVIKGFSKKKEPKKP